MFNVMIKGHTLEIMESKWRETDPWTASSYEKKGIEVKGTSGPAWFVLADGTWIWRLNEGFTEETFMETYSSELLKVWEDVLFWLQDNASLTGRLNRK